MTMKRNNFIEVGKTKAVDMDFTLVFPSKSYFVNVNMLVEFTPQGRVIPTRMDVSPYKMSAFAGYNESPVKSIDTMKFVLVIYTAYCVLINF